MYNHLPKNQKEFSVEITGSDTFVKYTGDFTVRCILNMAGKHEVELEKTRLMADYANPSQGLRGLATILSTLRAKIIKAPEWWDELRQASNILDENVIVELFDKVTDAEEEWREKVKKQSEMLEAADKANEAIEKEAAEKAEEEGLGN